MNDTRRSRLWNDGWRKQVVCASQCSRQPLFCNMIDVIIGKMCNVLVSCVVSLLLLLRGLLSSDNEWPSAAERLALEARLPTSHTQQGRCRIDTV